MTAYHNDPALKERFVAEVERHRLADQIIQGCYGEKDDDGKWRGCAVGCSVHSLNLIQGTAMSHSDHAAYAGALGIPEWLARLEDTIFEGLPHDEAKQWPGQFARAIPVGADLEPVRWHFCAYLMRGNIERVLSLGISDDLKTQVVGAIRGVLAVHEQAIGDGVWDESAARSARSAAASAAASAAWSAECAWSAWSAPRSARSARSAAASAAASAAWSAECAESAWSARSARSAASAAWSAESAAYGQYASELLALLAAARTGSGVREAVR